MADAFSSWSALLSDIKKRGGFDLLILDIIMPGISGMDLAKEMRKQNTVSSVGRRNGGLPGQPD